MEGHNALLKTGWEKIFCIYFCFEIVLYAFILLMLPISAGGC